MALVEIPKRLGDGLSVKARVLDVVTYRFAVGAQIDHHIIVENAITDGFARTQFYVQAVRCRVVIEASAHSRERKMPEVHQWSKLTSLQIGRYAEYYVKMQFVLLGCEVYSAEVDDRGIDFVLRREPNKYWDVQVKSKFKSNYIFFQKEKFAIRDNLLAAIAIFDEGRVPELFLIPATAWAHPNSILVDRDFGDGKKSKPEYGVNLSRRGLALLEQYRFEHTVAALFTSSTAPHGLAEEPLAGTVLSAT